MSKNKEELIQLGEQYFTEEQIKAINLSNIRAAERMAGDRLNDSLKNMDDKHMEERWGSIVCKSGSLNNLPLYSFVELPFEYEDKYGKIQTTNVKLCLTEEMLDAIDPSTPMHFRSIYYNLISSLQPGEPVLSQYQQQKRAHNQEGFKQLQQKDASHRGDSAQARQSKSIFAKIADFFRRSNSHAPGGAQMRDSAPRDRTLGTAQVNSRHNKVKSDPRLT